MCIYIGMPGMLLMVGGREEKEWEVEHHNIEGRMKLPFARETQASK